eukprot:9469169-Pyramimonas_sp.AAC.1
MAGAEYAVGNSGFSDDSYQSRLWARASVNAWTPEPRDSTHPNSGGAVGAGGSPSALPDLPDFDAKPSNSDELGPPEDGDEGGQGHAADPADRAEPDKVGDDADGAGSDKVGDADAEASSTPTPPPGTGGSDLPPRLLRLGRTFDSMDVAIQCARNAVFIYQALEDEIGAAPPPHCSRKRRYHIAFEVRDEIKRLTE